MCPDAFSTGSNAYGNRKVVCTAFLAQICRGQVQDQFDTLDLAMTVSSSFHRSRQKRGCMVAFFEPVKMRQTEFWNFLQNICFFTRGNSSNIRDFAVPHKFQKYLFLFSHGISSKIKENVCVSWKFLKNEGLYFSRRRAGSSGRRGCSSTPPRAAPASTGLGGRR